MDNNVKKGLQKQVDHWTSRRDDLADWLTKHSYEDSNYQQNQSDYAAAVLKVDQLNDRKDGEVNGPRDVGKIYPMPTKRINS
jgi:hypothetical protein